MRSSPTAATRHAMAPRNDFVFGIRELHRLGYVFSTWVCSSFCTAAKVRNK
jgi:hypothetical protein